MDEDQRNLINIYSQTLLDINSQIQSLLNTQRIIVSQLNSVSGRRFPRDQRAPRNYGYDNYYNYYNPHRRTVPIIYNDIHLIPTTAQIQNACRDMLFSEIENPLDNRCPISLDSFSPDTPVTQIIHCGHIFNRDSLNSWFSRNVRCPVCRYDIRNYSVVQEEGGNEQPQESRIPEDVPVNSELTNAFSSLINEMFPLNSNRLDPSSNSFYYDSNGGAVIFEGFIRR